MKHKSLIIFSVLHLFLITIIVIHSIVNSYTEFYSEKRNKTEPNLLSHLLFSPPIQEYTILSGINTGYGFFAPNIGSEVFTEFTIHQKDKKPHLIYAPKFQNNESWHKYSTMLSSYLDELTAKDTTKVSKTISKLRTEYIAKNVLREYPKAYAIDCKIFVYRHPSLQETNNSSTITPLKILTDQITLTKK